jgi:DHA3 family macrolide efflux protein-like MFS transporter
VLFSLNAVQVWHIYAAMALRAIGQTFHFPALQAAIPMIVPEKELSRAAGLNQLLYGLITIAGPPFGALLLGLLPMQSVLLVDILTAIIAVGCLLLVHIPQPLKTASVIKPSVIGDMKAGFRYIWDWRGLTILIGVSVVITFFLTPAFTLLPILVTRFLEGDVLKLGWLNSAFGIGMIAGGLILGVWKGFKRRMYTCLMGVIIAGAATVGLGTTSLGKFLPGVISCFFMGLGLSFTNGPIMAIMQARIDKDMQGRVFSLTNSISSAATPLGLAFAGPVADAIGIQTLYYIAGAAILLVCLVSFISPSLMNLDVTENSKL